MAFVKLEELTDEGVQKLMQNKSYSKRVSNHELTLRPRTMEDKIKILNELRDMALTAGRYHCKEDRPWYIIPDYFNRLDETQSWMGFEFESDWNSAEARKEAVQWVWDNIEGCCFDPEGSSGYSTEITLPPQEVSKYVAEEAEFQKMMKGLCALDERGLGSQSMSGTHLNISTPALREDSELTRAAVDMLNNSMGQLTPAQRATLFSRAPTYGGAFNQSKYIELKVFRSTYSYEQFQQYVQRGLNIVKLVEAFEKVEDKMFFQVHEWSGTRCNTYCPNFFEVVNEGAEPVFANKPADFVWDSPSGIDKEYVDVKGEDQEYWSEASTQPVYEDDYDDDDYDYDEDDDGECYCDECCCD